MIDNTEILKLLSKLSDEQKDVLIDFLRQLQMPQETVNSQ
ncbi:hypothetical protein SDC9_177450 [bioreactor metagenome]|uniref:Uncharacterized protein n=1 Tax=bioreactor metagenome TaxID=1076179 RepID=A0A645H2B7_9ZZZZ